MNTLRYLNRIVFGIIMMPFFFLLFLPLFMYMDWLFEENEDEYVSASITASFWGLFKWKNNQEPNHG